MDALKASMERHAGEAKGKTVEMPGKKPARRAEGGARRKAS